MCGFSGYFPSINRETDYAFLNAMLADTRYRGPDQCNIYRNDNIALGHHRLSIIDLIGGQQPVIDSITGNCLVYNGEIYDFLSHRKFLIKNNIKLQDTSDTEVLFKMLTNFGVDYTLKKIDGMFSFIFYCKKENSVYLVRDRTGEKPLYFAKHKNFLIFGSELKNVASFPGLKKKINYSSINEYLNFDYIPYENTLITGIKKILPGHYLKYSNNNQITKKYWSLEWKKKSNFNLNENLVKLDSLLDESIKNRLIADVPVGLFLSGGIDSSLIAYYCKKHSKNIKTFTIQMPNDSYDEYKYALSVSKYLGLRNINLKLDTAELIKALEKIEESIDEPINDPSLLPTYLVSKLARKYVKVALSGDGADELFSGYAPYKHINKMIFLSYFPKSVGKLLYFISNKIPTTDNYMSYAFLLKHVSKGIGYKPEQQVFRWMSSFRENDIKKLFSKDFNKQYFDSKNLFDHLVLKYKNKNISVHEKISDLFFNNYLSSDLLTKVDRMSMLNSLEVRAPFLSKSIIDFSTTVPNNHKVNNNTKYILRALSNNKLPKNIVERKKHGFAVPLASMLRTELKEKVFDTLVSKNAKISSFTNPLILKKILDNHSKGIDNRKTIWSLYILEHSIKNLML